jgi:hypothetical protein
MLASWKARVTEASTRLARCWAMTVPVFALIAVSAVQAGETVHYRLAKARTIELKDQATADAFTRSLKQLGCEHRLDGHEGHFHLTFRCPSWRQTQFADHDMAHRWQDWLHSLGFEVNHDHH